MGIGGMGGMGMGFSGGAMGGMGMSGGFGFGGRGGMGGGSMTRKQESMMSKMDSMLKAPDWSHVQLQSFQKNFYTPHSLTTNRPPVRNSIYKIYVGYLFP